MNRLSSPAGDALASDFRCAVCRKTVDDLDRACVALGSRLVASISSSLADELAQLELSGAGLSASVRSREFALPVSAGQAPPERIGHYDVFEQLGRGGMGTVYRARHSRLQKDVALKVLTCRSQAQSVAIARFEREMAAIGRLQHPNVVTAFDAGEEGGIWYLSMELVDGFDLAALTKDGGRLEIADACEIARQAAVGLQHAHSLGLVHRDVKPSNLMLAAAHDGTTGVKVLDLGLALIGDAVSQEEQLTDEGQLMGTLDFMAPEQTIDTHAVDHRADIYSLGATLYRMITGRVPHAGAGKSNPAQRLRALMVSSVPGIRSHRETVAEPLAGLIDRMLRRDIDQRPGDMSEVVETLAEFTSGSRLDVLLANARNRFTRAVETGDLSGANKPAAGDTSPADAETIAFVEPLIQQRVVNNSGDVNAGRSISDGPESPGHRNKSQRWAFLAIPVLLAGVVWVSLKIEFGASDPGGTSLMTLKVNVSDRSIPAALPLDVAAESEADARLEDKSKSQDSATPIDRWEIAHSVIEHGGRISLGSRSIQSVNEIPDDAFEIRGIEVYSAVDADVPLLSAWIAQLPECRRFYLASRKESPLTDAAMSSLNGLQHLTSLSIRSKGVTDDGITQLNTFSQLTALVLAETRVSKRGIIHIKESFPSLTALGIESFHLTTDDLEPVTTMKNLDRLDLTMLKGDPVSLEPLRGATLKSLTLRGPCRFITGAGELLASMPCLESLTFFLAEFNDEELMSLVHAQHLNALHFHQSPVTTEMVKAFKAKRSDVDVQIH